MIFPNCPDLPLTAVEDLPKLVPGIEETFAADGSYTLQTETLLLSKFGG